MLFLSDLFFQIGDESGRGQEARKGDQPQRRSFSHEFCCSGHRLKAEKLEPQHMRRASADSVVARCVGSMFGGATRLMRMANELVSEWRGAMT